MGLHALAGGLAAVALLRDPDPRAARLRTIAWVVGIVTWASFLWAGSRSTLIGLAAALAMWFWRSDRAGRRRLLIVAGGLLAGGLVLSAVNWSDKSYLGWWHWWARTADAAGAVDASALTSHRSDFWRGAMAHLGDAPWFGLGPDAYGYLTPRLEGAQPHNLLLQLLLDVGIVGTLAVAWIVVRTLRAGLRSPAALDWFAATVGFLVAAQVDGYFFYPLAAFPALIALGACGAPAADVAAAARARPAARAWRPLALAAAIVLLLHIWLFRVIVHGAPPASPDALVARVWRHFPSVTYNVDAWADAWAGRYPDAALATSRRAVPHSQSPDFFRVQIARLLLARGDHVGAVRELELAAAEATPQERPAIESILARVRGAPAAARPRP
jgi:O-antigen ligase